MEARALPSGTLAPWAEVVAGSGSMTVADLLRQPDDDGWRYELVEGALVRVVGSCPKAVRITMRLLVALDAYVHAQELGQVMPPDAVYDFENSGQPNTGLLPDIGFYVAAREALVVDDEPYPFAPDLAVEVASPLQDRRAMGVKARRYLAGGTQLVWVNHPHYEQVDVWQPGNTRPAMTLGLGDALDGATVVPGFRYSVASLFR